MSSARLIGQLRGHTDSVLCCEASLTEQQLTSGGEVRSKLVVEVSSRSTWIDFSELQVA